MNEDSQPIDNTESGKRMKKAKKYPSSRRLIVGKGLSREQRIDAVMEFVEAYEKEEADLNREHTC